MVAPSPEAMRIWMDVIVTGAEGYTQFMSWGTTGWQISTERAPRHLRADLMSCSPAAAAAGIDDTQPDVWRIGHSKRWIIRGSREKKPDAVEQMRAQQWLNISESCIYVSATVRRTIVWARCQWISVRSITSVTKMLISIIWFFFFFFEASEGTLTPYKLELLKLIYACSVISLTDASFFLPSFLIHLYFSLELVNFSHLIKSPLNI